MQLVSYWSDNKLLAGAVDDGKLVDAAKAGKYPSSLRAILESGQVEQFINDARDVIARGDAIDVKSVRLGPPIPNPDKILCLGLNYSDHAAEAKMELPTAPIIFPKFANSLIGPVDDVVVPRAATAKVDYEIELAAVIGTRTREVAESDALAAVVGYSVFNDVSARDLQLQTSQWAPGKAIDTFAPMGPGIVPASEVGDPQNLMMTARVNGEIVQHESTSRMIFSVAQTIAFLSNFMTLEPGDIIATGTPAGIGAMRTPPLWLKPNDIVEMEIQTVGMLRNRIQFR